MDIADALEAIMTGLDNFERKESSRTTGDQYDGAYFFDPTTKRVRELIAAVIAR